jgi:hypothetical protein
MNGRTILSLLFSFIFLSCIAQSPIIYEMDINDNAKNNEMLIQKSREQLTEYKTRIEKRQNIIDRVRSAGSPIIVMDHRTSLPNSAGGIDCFIKFINISDKRTKYLYFTVVPYNKVNDITYSTIDKKSEATLEYTGYILPDNSDRGIWDNVWYNPTIEYMKITEIKIIFDDNSCTA